MVTLIKVQQNRTILLVESFKLDPRALDEGPRLKSGELRLNLHGTSFGGKINWYGPKNKPKKKVHHLKNQIQTRQGPTERFSLLQMGPNWFT
jgi:hypothetical protein